jgi:methyl-accepting chemotaxis protein
MTPNTETLLIVFVALTGLAILLQACILLAMFLSLRKTAKCLMDVTTDLKATIFPMVHSTRNLVERITPQVLTISSGLADLTETVNKHSSGFSESASEIMTRIHEQIKRLDLLLTRTLNTVEKASSIVEHTVAAPVRQANGVVAAIKAVVGTYRSGTPTTRS